MRIYEWSERGLEVGVWGIGNLGDGGQGQRGLRVVGVRGKGVGDLVVGDKGW